MPDINMTMTQAQAVSMTLTGGGAVTAARVAAVGAVMDTDFTAADEVMVGTGAGTHQQVTLGASELLGKKATGAVTNVTGAEARTILGLGTAAVADTGTTSGTVPVLGASGLPAVGASLLTGLTDAQVADPAVVDVSGDVAAGQIALSYSAGRRVQTCDLGAAVVIEVTAVTGLVAGGGAVLVVRFVTSGAGITYTFPAGTVIHGTAPSAAGENEVQFDLAADSTLHAYLVTEGATA